VDLEPLDGDYNPAILPKPSLRSPRIDISQITAAALPNPVPEDLENPTYPINNPAFPKLSLRNLLLDPLAYINVPLSTLELFCGPSPQNLVPSKPPITTNYEVTYAYKLT
jgi:hypothetical protein